MPTPHLGDPKHNVPAFQPSGSRTPTARQSGAFPEPPVVTETHVWLELTRYERGEPENPGAARFAERVASEIRAHTAAGRKVEQVLVTGFSDGLRNDGVTKIELADFPKGCTTTVTLPVDDTELAHLRGCILFEQISKAARASLAGGVSWKQREFDEPTGGKSGYDHRKVRVDIYLRRRP